ncbi:MAG: Hpt domain-containing protein, partial [Bdellovibrionaceae bacterium]|nr:Hpt domain-containing protein [Pseudobdellovibrionaceae bacterium]MDW8191001.1 Hpt domain-containing protein [Pseudobdellovibrionaceae bacterium]
MDEFEIELKKGFLEEAQQAIGEVEQSFLDLEGNPNDENTINKIFRLAHNLKGSSKAVGFEDMGEFTHAFESFILRIKNKELPVTSQTINMLLRANDHLKMMIAAYVQDLKAEVPYRHLVEEMKNFKIEDVTQTSTSDGNVLEFESPSLGISLEKLEKKSISTPNPASLSDQSIRVSLQKVEKLINYVGEMVILQSVLWEQIQTIDHPILSKAIHQLSKVGREIQDLSMSLRMVPIKPTFQKMVRIVR